MKKRFSSTKKILNIAHRGASAVYPENTMAAFKGAVEMGADMIELDVRLSKDGVPVIFHNPRLDAPVKAGGGVEDTNLSALKEIDVGSWRDPVFASERIPTLEEALVFASEKQIAVNIEIKTDDTRLSIGKNCISLVEKYNMEEHVLFSSFDMKAMKQIKAAEPDIATALLLTNSVFNRTKPSELVAKHNADAFHCTCKQLTEKRLTDLKEHQIPVAVYTVNLESKMKKLIEMGVNGIFTDRPDLLNQILYGK